MRQFIKKTEMPASAQAVFDWHKDPEALKKLIPPWEKVTLETMTGPISQEGSRVTLKLQLLGPLCLRWISEHHHYIEGRQFQDTQISGPFHFWEHTHRVLETGPNRCVLEDAIHYELPLGWLGDFFGHLIVRRKLERMFEFRHLAVLKDFQQE